jgi:hypothetical protein
MRKLALVLIAFIPLYCQSAATQSDLAPHLVLDVSSYDAASGEFTLLLRNRAPRDIYFLHYLVEFSGNPQPDSQAQPSVPSGEPVVFHEALLKAGESSKISGTCTHEGLCKNAGVFAGVYTCWSNSRWQCNEYTLIWSGKPLNGP